MTLLLSSSSRFIGSSSSIRRRFVGIRREINVTTGRNITIPLSSELITATTRRRVFNNTKTITANNNRYNNSCCCYYSSLLSSSSSSLSISSSRTITTTTTTTTQHPQHHLQQQHGRHITIRRPLSSSSTKEKGLNVTFETEESMASKDETTTTIDRSKYTNEIPIKMPDMGLSDDDCSYRIIKWYKSEGDIIERNDILCDIETPDFTFGMETDDEHLAIMGTRMFDAVADGASSEADDVAKGDFIKEGEVICTILHENNNDDDEPEEGE